MRIDYSYATKFIDKKVLQENIDKAKTSLDVLINKTGEGNDFLGWIDLPVSYSPKQMKKMLDVSNDFWDTDIVIVIGIGGSYLGAKAVMEALKPHFYSNYGPEMIFAGHTLTGSYYKELIDYIKDRDFKIVVISKSGTTTEPAIAFRLLYKELQKKYNKSAIKNNVICITDKKKGALRQLADKEGFNTFVIDDNVGGRFSVFSPVGLVPIAIAGFNMKNFLSGAREARKICLEKNNDNPAILYAAVRNALYASGYKIELLANYNLKLNYIAEWWKQLFGESEGKKNKGIFPASASFTTDLHSLGQYIQQGERHIFETVLLVNKDTSPIKVPTDKNDLDKLNYLAGKTIEYVNSKAAEGTLYAHVSGNVPNIKIEINEINERNLGFLMYFYEMACGISAYVLGVNPFDQPGVEDYKKNMFKLLGKE